MRKINQDRSDKADDLLGNNVTVNASDTETVHDQDLSENDLENWDSFPDPSADLELDPDMQNLDPDSPYMKALMQYNEDEIEDFMNGSGVEEMPQFSDDFEARLQESMRKAKPSAFKDKPEKKKHGKILSFFAVSRARRVAAIIMIIVAFTGATVSVDAVKIPLKKFLKDVQVKYARVSAVEEETIDSDEYEYPTAIEKKFELEKSLPGFKLIDINDANKKISHIYSDDDGANFYFFYQFTRDYQMYGNNEYESYEDLDIYWGKAIYYDMGTFHTLVWYYDDYMFSIEGDLSKEQMKTLSESMILSKD